MAYKIGTLLTKAGMITDDQPEQALTETLIDE
jgi:hypothetical protein